jgi:hypothetical protein
MSLPGTPITTPSSISSIICVAASGKGITSSGPRSAVEGLMKTRGVSTSRSTSRRASVGW